MATNIYVYTCDKNLKNRLPVYKSDKNYEKFLDLLLYEVHYIIINNISRFFFSDEKNKIYFCRNCCNKLYSQKNSMNIYNFVKQIKLKYYYLVTINIYNLKIYKIQLNIILFVLQILKVI